MDYGNLLIRTWNIVWSHKYLILLGALAALGSGGGGSFGTGGSSGGESGNNGFQFEGAPPDIGQIGPIFGLAIGVFIVLIAVAIVIGLIVWAISRIATGGLIAAADTIDGGGLSSFGRAWQAGWTKGWRLLGIGLLPLIPVLVLLGAGVGLGILFYGLSAVSNEFTTTPPNASPFVALGALACVVIPIALALALLSTFADRACILEDLSVMASYRRGWDILSSHLGPALILFVIQVGLTIAMVFVFFVPGVIMSICCLFWPLLLLVHGAVTAYFSTMWTLAWREWTGLGQPAA
jgi:hypothetical protein